MELLKRKNMMLDDYNCIFCHLAVEKSLLHLFLACPFAARCWATLHLQVDNLVDPFDIMVSFNI